MMPQEPVDPASSKKSPEYQGRAPMEFSLSTFFGVTAENPLMTNQRLMAVARQPTSIEYLQYL